MKHIAFREYKDIVYSVAAHLHMQVLQTPIRQDMRLTERTPEGVTRTKLEPTKILCLGRNYAEHAKEMGGTIPEEPMLFLKPPSCLLEDGGVIQLPPESKVVHHEVELAVVIGKRASRITAQQWDEHVHGYGIFLDITARDLQEKAKKRGEPWTVCKGFDTFGPISPITPKNQVRDPHRLEISLKRNGDLKQKSNTQHLIFKIPKILEYASTIMTLEPGDIISTGTPEGVGEIRSGDVLEAKIQEIGALNVTVRR
jgi:2-keto-4-pentenoate hydratase/2-oxohepta-3-ene-1,7-dioic acid hydratase in catechol pathway